MDEHVIVDGATKLINADLIDHNIKSLKWQINKYKKNAEYYFDTDFHFNKQGSIEVFNYIISMNAH